MFHSRPLLHFTVFHALFSLTNSKYLLTGRRLKFTALGATRSFDRLPKITVPNILKISDDARLWL